MTMNSITDLAGTAGSGIQTVTMSFIPLKIFVSSSTYDGNLGGVSGADSKCTTDANNPNDGHTYKALIVDAFSSTRISCTSANCVTGGTSEHIDWVLTPNTEYVRTDGSTVIATTTSVGLFSFTDAVTGLTNSISTSATVELTGLNSNWTAASGTRHCGGWASASNSLDVDLGQDASAKGTFAISAASDTCDHSHHLYCVEQ
jgi:hypothetical protein